MDAEFEKDASLEMNEIQQPMEIKTTHSNANGGSLCFQNVYI